MFPSHNNQRMKMTPFEAGSPAMPFSMPFPSDAMMHPFPLGQQQSVVTKTFSSSSRSVQVSSGGKLVHNQTFREETEDTLLGSHTMKNNENLSYNTGSRTKNQYATVTRGGKNGLETTGRRIEYKSGNEAYTTQVGDDVKTSSNDFETSTQDDFRYSSQIPPGEVQKLQGVQDQLANTSTLNVPHSLPRRNSDAIPMWGPDKMGSFVDETFSKMPPPRRPSNPSPAADLFLLELQMRKMQEDFLHSIKEHPFQRFPAVSERHIVVTPTQKSSKSLSGPSFLFPGKSPTKFDMGCIHSSRTETISKVPKDKTKDKAKDKTKDKSPKKELENSALKAHNAYRGKHGVPPLSLSKELCDMAQKWANHLADVKVLKHSSCELNGEKVGENVAYKWSSDGEMLTGDGATDNWYSEIKDYNFDSDGMSSGTGHFTQVVWKGSKQMGIGRGRAEDGSYFVVANYQPAGNVINHFKENVFRPKN
ncbi:hypothetical protein Ahia01_000972300 [Argonauta hians]